MGAAAAIKEMEIAKGEAANVKALAESTHAACAKTLAVSTHALQQASAAKSEGKSAVAAAKEATQSLEAETAVAYSKLGEALHAWESFKDGPLKAFTELKYKGSAPEPRDTTEPVTTVELIAKQVEQAAPEPKDTAEPVTTVELNDKQAEQAAPEPKDTAEPVTT